MTPRSSSDHVALPPDASETERLEDQLRARASTLGFDLCGIAAAVTPSGINSLRNWIDAGFAGEMGYIPRRVDAYQHPENVLPEVRSVVMVAMNYHDGIAAQPVEQRFLKAERRHALHPPSGMVGGEARAAAEDNRLTIDAEQGSAQALPARSERPSQTERGEAPSTGMTETKMSTEGDISSPKGGRVAKYASGSADYHDLLKQRLKLLAKFLHEQRPGCRTRPVVDTAPLLERDFARRAGLGWFGKNTMLINRRSGSWLFLGALLTDVELEPDAPHETSHCGTCTRCLDACPTDAFVEPYVLDARRCISYLTIELRDQPIPESLRDGMGNWVFGCDVCQDVCPWNRKAPRSSEPAFAAVGDLTPTNLNWLLSLSENAFRSRFRGTPLARPGRSGVLRNAAIAAGNSGDTRHLPALSVAAADACDLIRDAATWAISKLAPPG